MGKFQFYLHPNNQNSFVMASVSSFVQSPTEAILNSCTKDQLLKLVEHYGVDIGDKKLKEEIKGALRAALIQSGVLPATVQSNAAVESVSPPVGLTFEQQKELLLLTLNAEMEKKHLKHSLEKDKLNAEMEKEHLKQSLEKEKLGLQQYRLDLIKAGMIVGNAEGSESSEEPATAQVKGFDVVRNLRLIPKFNEKNPHFLSFLNA